MEKKKKSKVKKLKSELEETKAGWQRTQADFENYRKRVQEELLQEELKGRFNFAREFLPVFDNFERAYKHISEKDKKKSWVQGIIAIEKQFQSILSNLGIEKYHLIGKKFDSALADALFYEESDQPEGTIIEELEPGYIHKPSGKILRHARVKVSSGKKKKD
jgi:molecular chaperone GrpE